MITEWNDQHEACHEHVEATSQVLTHSFLTPLSIILLYSFITWPRKKSFKNISQAISHASMSLQWYLKHKFLTRLPRSCRRSALRQASPHQADPAPSQFKVFAQALPSAGWLSAPLSDHFEVSSSEPSPASPGWIRLPCFPHLASCSYHVSRLSSVGSLFNVCLSH